MSYRKIFACILIFGGALFSCGNDLPTKAQSDLIANGELTQEQVDLINRHVSEFPNETQISIAFVQNNEVSFVGVKRVDNILKVEDNQNAVFEIGSITKVFTSTLLAEAILEGNVTLDESIQDILSYSLKQSKLNGSPITYLTLANHTSGLPRLPDNMNEEIQKNPDNPYVDYNDTKLQFYLENQMKLISIPGENYAYSNLGMGLLGYLMELKSGLNYEDLLQEKIFTIYEMTSSTTDRSKIQNKLVSGLDDKGEVTLNWDLNSLKGAGAILSSTTDLSKFALANLESNPVFDLQKEITFTVNADMDLALGWHVLNSSSGNTYYWHNGGTGGYRSSLTIDHDSKIAVIILSNVSAFNSKSENIDQLGFDLIKTLE